jgi:hypothetical protein
MRHFFTPNACFFFLSLAALKLFSGLVRAAPEGTGHSSLCSISSIVD